MQRARGQVVDNVIRVAIHQMVVNDSFGNAVCDVVENRVFIEKLRNLVSWDRCARLKSVDKGIAVAVFLARADKMFRHSRLFVINVRVFR